MKVFYSYSDPGHGWLKVPMVSLHKLGIAYEISCYSYRRGDWAYLEEDRDAGVFIEAYRHATKEDPIIKRGSTCANKRSRIRNYPAYYREL